MRLPKFLDSRWLPLAGLATFLAGCAFSLAACTGTVSKTGAGIGLGGASEDLKNAGRALTDKGDSDGNPITSLLGTVLQVVGGLGVAAFGVKKVAGGVPLNEKDKAEVAKIAKDATAPKA